MPRTFKALMFLLLPMGLAAGCGEKLAAYPKDVRKNFVEACVAKGAPEQLCTCVLGKIEKKWTLAAYEKLENTLAVEPAGQTSLAALEVFKTMGAACRTGG